MARSQAATRLMPNPALAPRMLATTGFGMLRMFKIAACTFSISPLMLLSTWSGSFCSSEWK